MRKVWRICFVGMVLALVAVGYGKEPRKQEEKAGGFSYDPPLLDFCNYGDPTFRSFRLSHNLYRLRTSRGNAIKRITPKIVTSVKFAPDFVGVAPDEIIMNGSDLLTVGNNLSGSK